MSVGSFRATCHLMVRVAAVLLCTLFPSLGSTQSRLCPAPKPLPADVDDSRVREADFTRERFVEALAYFDDLAQQLAQDPKTSALTEKEGFWIGNVNSRIHLEGYGLRLQAQLEFQKTRRRGPAVRRFCDFVARTKYLD